MKKCAGVLVFLLRKEEAILSLSLCAKTRVRACLACVCEQKSKQGKVVGSRVPSHKRKHKQRRTIFFVCNLSPISSSSSDRLSLLTFGSSPDPEDQGDCHDSLSSFTSFVCLSRPLPPSLPMPGPGHRLTHEGRDTNACACVSTHTHSHITQ